jgi:hypothetical protein
MTLSRPVSQVVRELPAHMGAVTLRPDSIKFSVKNAAHFPTLEESAACETGVYVQGNIEKQGKRFEEERAETIT